MQQLAMPHGGRLIDLYLAGEALESERRRAHGCKSWDLSHRQLCDLELLLNGAFSPLDGFMRPADYDRVVAEMRLADGTLWPIPVTLDVSEAFAEALAAGERVTLRDREGFPIATIEVEAIWRPDKARECELVFATQDPAHPGVAALTRRQHPVYLGGRLRGLARPVHHDFRRFRDDPAGLRAKFESWGWGRVVAFQTRNPMHRAHKEITFRAAQQVGANLLIHPVVGETMPGDIDHFSRVRCYEHILKTYPEQTTAFSLLPLAMRMAGPREALWHAIIRKNFGCSHLIVGRDHAGPGNDGAGRSFYAPYAAQELLLRHQAELGVEAVPFHELVYSENRAQYMPLDGLGADDKALRISGTEFRRRLREGLEVPEWFSPPAVVAELRRSYPPKSRQGFTVFLTGLPSAGKSTIANALGAKLLELGGRSVLLLDGDVVRKHLSSELGFSRAHRDLNIRRIGFVASEISRAGGIAICAAIAPYAETRRQVREMVEAVGGFVEVYVSTPLEVCMRRDPKGLYAKARAGLITGITGIDDPYEPPAAPEIEIDTDGTGTDAAAQQIVLKLEQMGYVA
jgi:sulfate adenylyltransferase